MLWALRYYLNYISTPIAGNASRGLSNAVEFAQLRRVDYTVGRLIVLRFT